MSTIAIMPVRQIFNYFEEKWKCLHVSCKYFHCVLRCMIICTTIFAWYISPIGQKRLSLEDGDRAYRHQNQQCRFSTFSGPAWAQGATSSQEKVARHQRRQSVKREGNTHTLWAPVERARTSLVEAATAVTGRATLMPSCCFWWRRRHPGPPPPHASFKHAFQLPQPRSSCT